MTNIFGQYAPEYYAAGMSVIPLHYHDKRPIPKDWSRFHDTLPDPVQQQTWVKHNSSSNIGLVLGAQSGIAVIDIDTDDEAIKNAILSVLPHSPWERVGKKGMVLAYRYNGTPTFRIKDVNGNTLVEHLSTRTQVVLPPSIHPETKAPYTSTGNLWEVKDQLPSLNPEIESILRGMLKELTDSNGIKIELSHSGWTKVTDYVSQGSRDVQMTSVAGLYANGVVRGELSLYDAIERMKAWYSTCTEHVAGDDIDIDKGIKNLVRFVLRDVHDRGKVLPTGWDEDLSDEDKEKLGLELDKDKQEWSFNELRDYLQEKFERHPVESDQRMDAIEYVLAKITQSVNLTSINEERLLRYIMAANGKEFTMSMLRKRLKEITESDVKGNDHAEIARAVIRDMEVYGPLRFLNNQFMTWGGSHWTELHERFLLKHITEEYGHLPAAKRNSDHRGILKTIASLNPNEICTQPVKGVNFANGMLMQNLTLKDHDQAYGMTYTLPFRYMPEQDGKAFKFMDFLAKCWGQDPDYEQKLDALQEVMCATIFGISPQFQKAILLFGAPKSGKSQLLEIVRALVPDNARCACPPDTWFDKFAPTTMYQKLLNTCGELSDKKPLDGQKFKQIVDGEEMSGQYKGQQIFQFKPQCAHWFASNHLPRTDDTSSAFNRRWLVFVFSRPVKTEDIVLNLGEQIVAEEREAIVAWAVQAMPRLIENRNFTVPASSVEAIKEMATANNSVRFFIEDSQRVTITPVAASELPEAFEKTLPLTSETKLHTAYWSFCLGAGGARPVGPRAFRMKMRELGIEMGFHLVMDETTNEAVYVGLTLAG